MALQEFAQRGCSYSFLDFTLDVAAERLVGADGEIKLRPKSFQVMRYLVERHGRVVPREELMDAVWGDVAVTDESITKCIADIRKALADDSQEIIRTVTRRGFLFQPEVLLVQPTPVPNEQQMQPRGAATTPSLNPWRRILLARWMLLGGMVTFGLVGLVSLQWRGYLFGRRPSFEAIAVLPFESLSNGTDQQYLADGMTEALITNLGQASPLRVIARTSVNQYQSTKKPVREIARELDVDVLVEGMIAQSGDHLRVTANLIQVSPEKHIWARSYERQFRDVLALQNEIAEAIAAEIQGKLAPQKQVRWASSHPVNPDAQLAYWKAQFLRNNVRNPDDIRKVVESFEQAVRLDPSYAPAQAALSMSYAMFADVGFAFPREVMPGARMAAERAIALDEQLAYAHSALGNVLLIFDRDWAGAEREARRAINLNPSDAQGHLLLGNYLAAVGRTDEALVEAKRARELDPLSFLMNWNVGRMLCLARRYDDALAELRRVGDMQRNSSPIDIWTFKSYWMKGRIDEAIAADLRLRGYRDALSAQSLTALRATYSKNGSRDYWTKLRELLLPKFRTNPIGWYRLAEINTYLGDKEEAFRWLQKAYEERPNWIPYIKVDPSLDPLRSDPRFGALLRQMSLSE